MRGKQEDRGSGIEGCRSAPRVVGQIVDVPVFDMVQWDPQERVQEPTAEHALVFVVKPVGVGEARPPGVAEYSATTAAEAVASTVVESVDDCEARPPGVEEPEFVFRDRIQQRAFERLADISGGAEKLVFKIFSQDQFLDVLVTRVKEQLGEVPFFVCQDRVQQRNFEQFADIPEGVEESLFVFFSQDKAQQRAIEQHIEFPVEKFRSQTLEKCVEVVKAVYLERVSKRICEQCWIFEMSKISSQDQMLHGVPVPQVIEQLMHVPKIFLQDRVQRWNAEKIVETTALVEEPVFIACRRGADRRQGPRVTCRRGASRRLSSTVCRQGADGD